MASAVLAAGSHPGILLPFIEAFLPFLPLIVLVMGNSATYGLWWGFLLSWIGVCLGSVTVFWIVRKLGGKLGLLIQKNAGIPALLPLD